MMQGTPAEVIARPRTRQRPQMCRPRPRPTISEHRPGRAVQHGIFLANGLAKTADFVEQNEADAANKICQVLNATSPTPF